jgi:hypothetical protein
MPQEPNSESNTSSIVAELLHLFGPAPVPSSESLQVYEEILARFLQDFAPLNFMEQMWIKELTDCTWEMARYTRQKTLLMQRRFVPRFELQEKRRNDTAKGKEALDSRLAEQNRGPATRPEDLLDDLPEEIDEILLQSDAEELDHVRALEVAFVYHQRIDKLLARAAARRNNVLDQIDRYQGEKFGQRLRRASDQMIQDAINTVLSELKQGGAPVIP